MSYKDKPKCKEYRKSYYDTRHITSLRFFLLNIVKR